MTQEEKQLLLTDLCARLPYGVQCEIGGLQHGPYTFTGDDVEDLIAGRTFKPYLRPMSSMTEEELHVIENNFMHLREGNWLYESIDEITVLLNSHHLDYRGLIPMGLALEATEGMYKTE